MMKEHIQGTSQAKNSFVLRLLTVSVIVGDEVNKKAHYDYNQ